MMRKASPWILLLALASCSSQDAASDLAPAPGGSSDTADEGSGGADAGTSDAASDGATVDAATDAEAQDGQADASPEAGADGGSDAGVEVEAGVDGGSDAGAEVEAGVDGGSDAGAEVEAGVDGGSDAGNGIVSLRVVSGDDALASYLISASPPAWNIFSGETVPLGRHFDTDHVSYHTALRFKAVAVPKGATVASARLRFYPTNEVDSSNALWLNVYAERAADSAPFDPSDYVSGRPDQRARTTAFIDHWLVRCNDSCTDLTEYDCPQRKRDCWNRDVMFEVPKDLAATVQEVIDQPGWDSGHALTILIVNAATDSDGPKYAASRAITGFDPSRGAVYAPQLEITLADP